MMLLDRMLGVTGGLWVITVLHYQESYPQRAVNLLRIYNVLDLLSRVDVGSKHIVTFRFNLAQCL